MELSGRLAAPATCRPTVPKDRHELKLDGFTGVSNPFLSVRSIPHDDPPMTGIIVYRADPGEIVIIQQA